MKIHIELNDCDCISIDKETIRLLYFLIDSLIVEGSNGTIHYDYMNDKKVIDVWN